MLHLIRRADARLTYSLFAALGAQVGGFAVLVPQLAASRGLTPGALGAALGAESAAVILTLLAAGRVADRVGPRPLAVGGAGCFAVAFALLAVIDAPVALWPSLAVYGVASGLLDLSANSTGADVERRLARPAMVSFHAGFSAAACTAALTVSAAVSLGLSAGAAYASLSALYAMFAAGLVRAPFPAERREREHAPATTARASALIRVPGVALAVVMCTVCFFGDGAIESFAAVVQREALGAGPLIAGVGIAAFHAASLAGRMLLAGLSPCPAIVLGGVGAAAGTTLVVLAPIPALGAAGLLVVGFALAPVIPTTLSLAARAAGPGRSGAAVSLVTSVGYSAFMAGPPLAGALGQATTLRATLAPVIASTLTLALIAATAPSVGGRDAARSAQRGGMRTILPRRWPLSSSRKAARTSSSG